MADNKGGNRQEPRPWLGPSHGGGRGTWVMSRRRRASFLPRLPATLMGGTVRHSGRGPARPDGNRWRGWSNPSPRPECLDPPPAIRPTASSICPPGRMGSPPPPAHQTPSKYMPLPLTPSRVCFGSRINALLFVQKRHHGSKAGSKMEANGDARELKK